MRKLWFSLNRLTFESWHDDFQRTFLTSFDDKIRRAFDVSVICRLPPQWQWLNEPQWPADRPVASRLTSRLADVWWIIRQIRQMDGTRRVNRVQHCIFNAWDIPRRKWNRWSWWNYRPQKKLTIVACFAVSHRPSPKYGQFIYFLALNVEHLNQIEVLSQHPPPEINTNPRFLNGTHLKDKWHQI